jgi:hypothetical protein
MATTSDSGTHASKGIASAALAEEINPPTKTLNPISPVVSFFAGTNAKSFNSGCSK